MHLLAHDNTFSLHSTDFITASLGWEVTTDALLPTTDGGETWQQIHYVIQ